MLFNCDVERWLTEKSTRVYSCGSETHFVHSEKCKSVLLERRGQDISTNVVIHNPELIDFYTRFVGGSIYNGFLILASPTAGGLATSQGSMIPDLDEAKRTAQAYGLPVEDMDDIFLISCRWMFFYAPGRDPRGPLRCFDRDYLEIYEDQDLAQVLAEPWCLEAEDNAASK